MIGNYQVLKGVAMATPAEFLVSTSGRCRCQRPCATGGGWTKVAV